MRHFLLAWLCAPVLLAQPVVYQGEFLYHEIETVVERRCDSSPLVTERNKETTGALAQISFDERTFSCPWATFSGKLTFLIPTIKLAGVTNSPTLDRFLASVQLRDPSTVTLSVSASGTGVARQAPRSSTLGLPTAPEAYFYYLLAGTNSREGPVNQAPRCLTSLAQQEQKLTAAGTTSVSVEKSCDQVQNLSIVSGTVRTEGNRIAEFMAQFDTYAWVAAQANSLSTTSANWRGVYQRIFVRSMWKFTATIPTDAISLASPSPPSGATLFEQSSQTFSATVQYTLASRPSGAIQLQVVNQAGAPVGSSTPASVSQGTSSRAVSISGLSIPAGTTKLFMTAVLLDRATAGATVLKESTPIEYPVVIPPDLSVDHVEVVQVVQDRDNSVPLIAEKDTVVRVFLRSRPQPVSGATGRLRGFRDGQELAPLAPESSITAPLDPQRENIFHSLQFRLPKEWIAEGELKLTAEAVGPGAFSDARPENNIFELPKPLVFRKTSWPRPFRIYYIPYCFNDTAAQREVCPNEDNIAAADSLLRKIYPFPASNVWYLRLAPPPTVNSLNTLRSKNSILQLVEDLYEYANFFLSRDLFAAPFVVFWLPDFYDGMAAFGDTLDKARVLITEENNPLTESAQLAAHRLAMYGYNLFTGVPLFTEACAGKTYELGFDPEEGRVKSSDLIDIGSKCDSIASWIAPYTYNRLLNYVKPGSKASSRLASEDDGRFAIISGSIDPDGSGRLNPIFQVAEAPPAPLEETSGEYCLRLSSPQGLLLERCFSLNPEILPDEPSRRAFSRVIPFVRDATRLSLRKGDQELTSIEASLSPPSVTIQSPGAGESWEGGRRSLVWTATDPDGDPLRFAVVYSFDNGETWIPLRTGLTEASLEIRPELLAGGGAVLLRVLASDGFHTASSTAGPITVVHRPKLEPAPATFDLRNVLINDSRENSFEIANTGTGPVTITEVSVENPRFSATLPRTPFVLPAASRRQLRVRYTASSTGVATGALILSAGGDAATLRVPLRANGISSPIPDIDVTPSRLDFGRVSANQASDQTLTIRNYGPARLNVSAITATNARYTVASGGAPFALEAGSSRTVTVRFRPVSVATETGALDITSDDPNRRTVRVDLTGIGN